MNVKERDFKEKNFISPRIDVVFKAIFGNSQL